MPNAWGWDRNLTYWDAVRAGAVDPAERRAVALLASVIDEDRFGMYCVSGELPSMGNVTGRAYVVRRMAMAVETVDGTPVACWCAETEDHFLAPPTDRVVAIRSLIEGEETAFRHVANQMAAFVTKMDMRGPAWRWCRALSAGRRGTPLDGFGEFDDMANERARAESAMRRARDVAEEEAVERIAMAMTPPGAGGAAMDAGTFYDRIQAAVRVQLRDYNELTPGDRYVNVPVGRMFEPATRDEIAMGLAGSL